MRIVIVGAGAVGTYLAERLSLEGQDVVIIESAQERVTELQASLDALVVYGNGSSPNTLAQAEVEKAELLIAVSDNDGANVLEISGLLDPIPFGEGGHGHDDHGEGEHDH